MILLSFRHEFTARAFIPFRWNLLKIILDYNKPARKGKVRKRYGEDII